MQEYRNLPAYLIVDSEFMQYFSLSWDGSVPEYVKQADTLEELAEALGIDADGLLAEVEQFLLGEHCDGYKPFHLRHERRSAHRRERAGSERVGRGHPRALRRGQLLGRRVGRRVLRRRNDHRRRVGHGMGRRATHSGNSRIGTGTRPSGP